MDGKHQLCTKVLRLLEFQQLLTNNIIKCYILNLFQEFCQNPDPYARCLGESKPDNISNLKDRRVKVIHGHFTVTVI